MQAALIGLDLGTTGCKSAVFDERLRTLGEAYIEYPLIQISPAEIEQDANLWWELAKRAVGQSVSKSGVAAGSVKGIGISSQGIAFVPVDRDFRPLRNAVSWLDTRAKDQKDRILDKFGESGLFAVTGKRASESYVLPKLLWLRENERDLFDRAFMFPMALDYITARLCGECVTDHTMASGTLFYDVSAQSWSGAILNEFDIGPGRLPGIRWSGSIAGHLEKAVAAELGLPHDVVIAVGGQDQKCAALGAGIGPGIATVSLGTASAIEQACEKPVLDGQMRIPCFSGLFPAQWVIEGCVPTAGASVKWLRETFFRNAGYDGLNDMAERSDVGAGGVFFYPHLAGAGSPYWKGDAGGTFHGITLSTHAHDFARSVYEGIAYQIRANLDAMQSLYKPAGEIRLFGGGAKSGVWRRIVADITGKPVRTLSTGETANAGAAILAGLACGVFGDASEAAALLRTAECAEPDRENAERYDRLYRPYMEIQQKLLS